MRGYLEEIIDEFPEELGQKVNTPAATHLFDINKERTLLSLDMRELYHQTVAKLLWVAMRARPDILTTLSFLTTRVKSPDKDNWRKLLRLLCYLKCTIDLHLRLSSDGTGITKWSIDAAFGN